MNGEQDESSGLESDEPHVPKTSGWPAWDLEAKEILSGIRHWVQKGGDESEVAYADFLQILDVFLSQLIEWAEQKDSTELRDWAGWALADRLQFLSTQKGDWCSENQGFKKRWAEFADRRRARSPRSYLGWLAGDYLRRLANERIISGVLLSPVSEDKPETFAELSNYSEERKAWLKKLSALRNFSPESAPQWAQVVFEKMEQDEQKILNSPQMGKCQTRDSTQRRPSGKVRLYDFKPTIVKAVVSLALKPVGHIRGITRPAY
jgi:hypothetical protein